MGCTFPISSTWFYKKKKTVGTGTLSCNILSKYKVIVYISNFLNLKANAQYLFENFWGKIRFEETLREKLQSNTDNRCKDAEQLYNFYKNSVFTTFFS